MTHMDPKNWKLIPFVFSHKLRDTLVSLMRTCPSACDKSRQYFSFCAYVVSHYLPSEDHKEAQDGNVPEIHAKVLLRGTIMMAFLAQQHGMDEIGKLLLDIAFSTNNDFALETMKEMEKIAVARGNDPIDMNFLLTAKIEPEDRKYELN
jgi:hypothetical protein